MSSKIIHIDMDAFYASIEQRDNPALRGQPVAVGYSGNRGVVAAASYEARRYGVRSAMPSRTAKYKCPNLIFTPARFDVYKEVSRQIQDIFLQYTDRVEPLSLDEAFLDVTTNHKGMPSATLIAREIKQCIREETGLTASAGVSFNKFLAKIASDYNKPDGLFIIRPAEAERFVESLKIERFFGVGRVTAEKMHSLGIYTGADLKTFSKERLIRHFGKAGQSFHDFARAIDEREVVPDRTIKSVGGERTFLEDITTKAGLLEALVNIQEIVWERVSRKQFYGKTLTLKIKYADFRIITRSITLHEKITDFALVKDLSNELMEHIDIERKGVRLIGLTLSNAESLPPIRQLRINFEY